MVFGICSGFDGIVKSPINAVVCLALLGRDHEGGKAFIHLMMHLDLGA